MGNARADRLRSKARKQLSRLLALHEHSCYWCKSPLVNVDTIPFGAIYRKSPTVVYWKIDDVHYACKMATIDHLKEISRGGNNEEGNIVPSCGSCNWRRSGNPGKFRKRMSHHPFYNTICNPSILAVTAMPDITPSTPTCLTSADETTSSANTTTT